MSVDLTNPYVGLRPFYGEESLLLFGRDEQTLELLQRLHEHHFVAVVGSSGCGKSSLLRAGLIPALKGGYLVDDSNEWMISIMKPGQSPLYNLAESILEQINPKVKSEQITELVQNIEEEGIDAILDILIPIRTAKRTNFFILVDQFEELFRFTMENKDASRKDEAIDFVNILLELSTQSIIPLYIVFTMRSDFIGDCAQFHGLPEAMNKSQYLVPRLNRRQLKLVIEGPARLYGGNFSSSLTSKLLNKLGQVQDELPLLQHILMRIWDYEEKTDKSGELDIEDYNNVGGLKKALSNHADEAADGMTEREMVISKEMFKALTAIDDNGRKIRRPLLLSDLKKLTGATDKELDEVIDHFIRDKRSFLMLEKAGDSGDKVIDISHESLIRQWDTLGNWVDEEAESASNYIQLAEATQLNQAKKKDYLSGSELTLALAWKDKFMPTAEWASRYKSRFEDGMFDTSMKYLNKSASISNYEQAEAKFKRNVIKLRNFIFLIIAFIFITTSLNKEKIESVEKNVMLSENIQKELLTNGILPISVKNSIYKSFQTNNTKTAYNNYLLEYKKYYQNQNYDPYQYIDNSIQLSSTNTEVKNSLNKILNASSNDKSITSDHPLSNKIKPFVLALQLNSPDNYRGKTNSYKKSIEKTHPWNNYYAKLKNNKTDSISSIFLVSSNSLKKLYPDLEKQKDFFEKKGILLVSQTEIEQIQEIAENDTNFIHLHLVPNASDKLKPLKDRSKAIKFITNSKRIERNFYTNPDIVEPINTISILIAHLFGYFALIFITVPIYRKLTFSPEEASLLEKFRKRASSIGLYFIKHLSSRASSIIFSIVFYLIFLVLLAMLMDIGAVWVVLIGLIIILFALIRLVPKFNRAVKFRIVQGVLFKIFGLSLILALLFDNLEGSRLPNDGAFEVFIFFWIPLFMGFVSIIIGYKKAFISSQEKFLIYSDRPVVFYYSSNEANLLKRHSLSEWMDYRYRDFNQKLLGKIFGVFGPFISTSRLKDSYFNLINDNDVEFSEANHNVLDAIKQSEFFIVQIEDNQVDSLLTLIKKVLEIINPNQLLLCFSHKIDEDHLELVLETLIEKTPANLPINMPKSMNGNRIISFNEKGVAFTCGRIILKSKSWLEKIMPGLASIRKLSLSQRSMKRNLRLLYDNRKDLSFKGKYFSDYAIRLAGFYPFGFGLPSGIMICRNLWLAKKRGKAIIGFFAPLVVFILLFLFGIYIESYSYKLANIFTYVLVVVFISPLISHWIWHKLSGQKLRQQLVLGSAIQPRWKNMIIIGSIFILFFGAYFYIIYNENKKYEAREINYERAREIANIGYDLAKEGLINEAIIQFELAKELDPYMDLNADTYEYDTDPELTATQIYSPIILSKAKTLAQNGDFEGAEKFYQEIIDNASPELKRDPIFWDDMAWNYLLVENGEKALEFSEFSIELSGQVVPVYLWENRGIAKALLNDFDGAITDFSKANESETIDYNKIVREEWITSLKNGNNPFTPELLRSWSDID